MPSAYVVRIWVNDQPYEDGWHISLHTSLHKAMMCVIHYTLVEFRIQDDSDYYDDDCIIGQSTKISTSDIIDKIGEEFKSGRGIHNVEFEIKNPSAKIKKLHFHVGQMPIH
jgi:hypothetical protein